MKKIPTIFFAVIFTCAALFAQDNNSGKSAAASLSEQNNYSESKPYTPLKFETPKSKSKKENKSEKSSNENNQTASGTAPNSGNNLLTAEKNRKIPISVFNRNGTPVSDLTKSDFKIFINDVEQEISNFIVETEPLNLFLIVDVSPSTAMNADNLKRFVAGLTAALQPEDKIQIIKFALKAKALTELTNDRKLIEKAVGKLKYEDGTSLYDSIPEILQKNINALTINRAAVVLLSDGVDTTSFRQNYETSLIAAEKSEAVFFTFYLDTFQDASKLRVTSGNVPVQIPGVGSVALPVPGTSFPPRGITQAEYDIGKQYMLDLAWLSGGKPFEIKNISELNQADFVKIPVFLKPQYTLFVNLNDSAAAGRRQIRVRVNRPNLTVYARGSLIVGIEN